MEILILKQNRAIYSLITTFFFIVILLFVVLGVIFVNEKISATRGRINTELGSLEDVMGAKNRILSKNCYGTQVEESMMVLNENTVNESCEFPEGYIVGYIIEMIKYKNCSNETKKWEHYLVDGKVDLTSSNQQVYSIIIKDNETGLLCPGLLKVIY